MAKRRRHLVLLSDDEEEDHCDSVSAALSTLRHDGDGGHGACIAGSLSSQDSWKSVLLETNSDLPGRSRAQTSVTTRGRKLNVKQSNGLLPFVKVIDKFPAAFKPDCIAGKLKDHASQSHTEPDFKLWVEKHGPRTAADLAVHNKKIGEVAGMAGRTAAPRLRESLWRPRAHDHRTGRGGKKRYYGSGAFEWKPPTPTLWQEHMHQATNGTPYMSKLDDFEVFLESASKLPMLPVVVSSSSPKSGLSRQDDHRHQKVAKVLMIEDLPLVNDPERQQRLCRLLHFLTFSVKFPTVVIITDVAENVGGRDVRQCALGMIQQTFQGAGATQIAFNPVTINVIKKLLIRVSVAEKCRVPPDSLSAIAESCGGDIRHALSSLQFLCLGYCPNLNNPTWDPGGLGVYKQGKAKFRKGVAVQQMFTMEDGFSRSVEDSREEGTSGPIAGRDGILSLFHALGKFLHNKRHMDCVAEPGQGTIVMLGEEHRRHPLNMDEPEIILSQAHTEPATVLAFLHENVLQFVDEDASDDVAAIAGYLSDTDCLLGSRGSWRVRTSLSFSLSDTNDMDPSHIAAAAAGSVASRGVLFANLHPAPRRWQSVRPPALWQVERLLLEKVMNTSKVDIWARVWASGLQSSFKSNGNGASFPAREQLFSSQQIPVQASVHDRVILEGSMIPNNQGCEIGAETLSADTLSSKSGGTVAHIYRRSHMSFSMKELDGCLAAEDEIEDC